MLRGLTVDITDHMVSLYGLMHVSLCLKWCRGFCNIIVV